MFTKLWQPGLDSVSKELKTANFKPLIINGNGFFSDGNGLIQK